MGQQASKSPPPQPLNQRHRSPPKSQSPLVLKLKQESEPAPAAGALVPINSSVQRKTAKFPDKFVPHALPAVWNMGKYSPDMYFRRHYANQEELLDQVIVNRKEVRLLFPVHGGGADRAAKHDDRGFATEYMVKELTSRGKNFTMRQVLLAVAKLSRDAVARHIKHDLKTAPSVELVAEYLNRVKVEQLCVSGKQVFIQVRVQGGI